MQLITTTTLLMATTEKYNKFYDKVSDSQTNTRLAIRSISKQRENLMIFEECYGRAKA